MATKITTQLMFEGTAEEAIRLYVSLFKDSRIDQIDHYGPGEHGAEGTVKRAIFTLANQTFACIDSPVKHKFTFTPSVSIFVDCECESELDAAFTTLSQAGSILMPPGNYGFSTKFTWIADRFGLSWQLNLP